MSKLLLINNNNKSFLYKVKAVGVQNDAQHLYSYCHYHPELELISVMHPKLILPGGPPLQPCCAPGKTLLLSSSEKVTALLQT